MATTNIQTFSGDVDVTSNILMSGEVFIKTNDGNGKVGIGLNAGQTSQGSYAVAVGANAGQSNQGSYAIAVGRVTGATSQGSYAIAMGYETAAYNQGDYSVAIGLLAGLVSQGTNAIAVGVNAGLTYQRSQAIAVGYQAGYSNQGDYSVAVGYEAGRNNQGIDAVAIARAAGYTGQGAGAVAMGYQAGYSNQGDYSVAVGYQAGRYNQGDYSVAVGYVAGESQYERSVAVGYYAGGNQGSKSVAVGYYAGGNQGSESVAVGYVAGEYQYERSVAVGYEAGGNQGSEGVAVGYQAGRNQYDRSVAVGYQAGEGGGTECVNMGYQAGNNFQGDRCVNMGYQACQYNQGGESVALGYQAGQYDQGDSAVALGYQAGQYNQPSYSFYVSTNSVRSTGGTAMYYDTSSGEISYSSSDDRMKVKETLIKDATTTLMKLSPQSYYKKFKLDEPNISHYESGLMAQDVWYDAPELRHMVHLGAYANPTPEKPPAPSDSLEDDPDYSAWGSDPAQVQYDQLIPYTIKSIQEIVTELPRSKTTVSNAWGQNIMGLIVSANTNAHKTNTTPIVALSNVYMDKKWYGVVSEKKTDTNDYDTLVDTKGDTQIWVTDVGGPLESGDLVTTSNVAPGYAQKQDDDLLRSSTVAKVTQDCDFTEPAQRPIRVPKKELSNVTYYIEKTEVIVDLYEYEQNLCERRKTMKTETVYRKIHAEGRDTVYFDADGNEVSKRKYETLTGGSAVTYTDVSVDEYNNLTPEKQADYTETVKNVYYRVDLLESPVELEEGAYDETEVRQELVDVLDENGQIVWEETGETEPVYTLVDHGTYKAALVSAKLV
jgi:hypothetical protein